MTIGDHFQGMRNAVVAFFSDPFHSAAVGIVLFGVVVSAVGFYDTLMYCVSLVELLVRLSWGYVYPLLALITWPTLVSWWSIVSWSIIVLVSSILVQIVGVSKTREYSSARLHKCYRESYDRQVHALIEAF